MISIGSAHRRRGPKTAAVLALLLATLAAGTAARAHDDSRPAALRDVDFEQKLDRQLPRHLVFRDPSGRTVRLGDLFGSRPVVLNFVYYTCRDLCPLLADGLVRALRGMSFSIGEQFDVVTVSFDPHDTAAAAGAFRKEYTRRYGRPGAERGWHFLTGDLAAIHELADAAGFRYTYDPQKNEFAHATGIVLVTPEGRTSRYYYGIEFSPRDLRLGMIEAAAGKIGSPIDQLLLFAITTIPPPGKYTPLVTRMLQLAGGGTVLALGGFVLLMLRRERHSPDGWKGST